MLLKIYLVHHIHRKSTIADGDALAIEKNISFLCDDDTKMNVQRTFRKFPLITEERAWSVCDETCFRIIFGLFVDYQRKPQSVMANLRQEQ